MLQVPASALTVAPRARTLLEVSTSQQRQKNKRAGTSLVYYLFVRFVLELNLTQVELIKYERRCLE